METETLKYPIGQAEIPEEITMMVVSAAIERIAALPDQLRQAVANLEDKQLDSPYRPEGWTLRQVVHHVAESHMNGFIRFKWALTEDTPKIKAYNEQFWSGYSDVREAPVDISLNLLSALHTKWTFLMKSISDEEWSRQYFHPEAKRAYMLKESVLIYDWHGRHHLAHITSLKNRMKW